MGRNYASVYEAWAVMRRQLEDIQLAVKRVAEMHGGVWDAVKRGDMDEAKAEMPRIDLAASMLCTEMAWMAAIARQAAKEL